MAQPQDKPEKKKLCFVIGPIGKAGSLERKHADLLLNAVIREGIQTSGFDLNIKRADDDSDPGMIGDRIISDILNANLVVADLTDLNPNVFYELGIRHSTQRPTIHIAREGTVLPFDNVSHRTIFVDLTEWHSIVQARDRLSESAKVALSHGYKASNPITQANASFRMRTSDDPIDRTIAQMQERFSALEMRVATREREDELAYTEQLLGKRPRKIVPVLPPGGFPVRSEREGGDVYAVERFIVDNIDRFSSMSMSESRDSIEKYARLIGLKLNHISVKDDSIMVESDHDTVIVNLAKRA